jgi:oxygen-independent coproporphyrinogen-3 oxidase
MLGLYVHIPYCRTICPYCDFVRRPLKGAVPQRFIDAVLHEIDSFDENYRADTVFFGGGTPSLVAPRQIDLVLRALESRFGFDRTGATEITLEANPDDVTPELASTWLDAGINRVSLGVQSFCDATLAYLGRRHDATGARRACEWTAERFDNWSIDLMFGAPPVEAWAATLAECRSFAPAHVSAYGLTYEPGTPFAKRAHEAVDEESYLALYHAAEEALGGYERYEVSNFARPAFACRHNLKYWQNEEYAGFGPGAYSFVRGVRSRNHADIEAYLASPGGKEEALVLSGDEMRVETLIQHFRLRDGLNLRAYHDRFGRDVRSDYGPALSHLIGRGLLESNGEWIRPTRRGFELNNEIGLALVA